MMSPLHRRDVISTVGTMTLTFDFIRPSDAMSLGVQRGIFTNLRAGSHNTDATVCSGIAFMQFLLIVATAYLK
jgi:hypothetical protein